jgi:hypothetical protein
MAASLRRLDSELGLDAGGDGDRDGVDLFEEPV